MYIFQKRSFIGDMKYFTNNFGEHKVIYPDPQNVHNLLFFTYHSLVVLKKSGVRKSYILVIYMKNSLSKEKSNSDYTQYEDLEIS